MKDKSNYQFSENYLQAMTFEEFKINIDTAIEDSVNDRGTSSFDLKEEIKKW